MQENLILAYYAQIWKFDPRLPNMEFFKKKSFFEKISRFRFQRALNDPQTLSLSQVMQENVIMPKYENSGQAPKNGIFQKKIIFLKGLQISLPTSPQPPPDIKFKSSYARKHDFGLLCPNMEIRPQAPKNRIFQKNFIFL